MNRRGFLGAMLAAAAAPAFVRAESLMKIVVPEKKIITLASLAGDFDGDVIGWDHELGGFGHHDWYMGEGGPRFERSILPPSFINAFNAQVSREDSNIFLFMPKEKQIVKEPPPKRRSFF